MGSRRYRARPAATWQPAVTAIWHTSPAGSMEDALIAGPAAYGARFWRKDNRAGFTVWVYPRHHGDCFALGFRVDREARDASGSWAGREYYCDVTWSEWLEFAEDAAAAARAVVLGLARGEREMAELYAAPEVVARWFDWDGTGLR